MINYFLTFWLVPKKSDERLVGNSGAMLKVKALSSISIEDVELAIGDADQSTAPKVKWNFYIKTSLRYIVIILSQSQVDWIIL